MFSKNKKYSAKDLIGEPPEVVFTGKARDPKKPVDSSQVLAVFKSLFPESKQEDGSSKNANCKHRS